MAQSTSPTPWTAEYCAAIKASRLKDALGGIIGVVNLPADADYILSLQKQVIDLTETLERIQDEN